MVVRISTATLQFYRGGELVKSYPISTSKRPPSNIKDSLGTPRGLQGRVAVVFRRALGTHGGHQAPADRDLGGTPTIPGCTRQVYRGARVL